MKSALHKELKSKIDAIGRKTANDDVVINYICKVIKNDEKYNKKQRKAAFKMLRDVLRLVKNKNRLKLEPCKDKKFPSRDKINPTKIWHVLSKGKSINEKMTPEDDKEFEEFKKANGDGYKKTETYLALQKKYDEYMKKHREEETKWRILYPNRYSYHLTREKLNKILNSAKKMFEVKEDTSKISTDDDEWDSEDDTILSLLENPVRKKRKTKND